MAETARETDAENPAPGPARVPRQTPEMYDPPRAIANGPPPLRGRPMTSAEIMALDASELPSAIPPPPLRGQPMSSVEIMKLRDEDLPCEAPIVDSHEQQRTFRYAGNVLHAHFADREDVTVGVDLGMYYLPEDVRGGVLIGGGWQQTPAHYTPLVVPDVLVAFGVPRRRYGGSYQTWNAGKVPDFVMEVASTSTWREDYGRKRDLYERLGIQEYFIYDARDGHQRLTAWRANAMGDYDEVLPAMHEGLGPGIRSELVGLVAFVEESGDFGWWDPIRRERQRDYEEERYARKQAERTLAESERALAEERERRRQAELAASESAPRIAELEAQLAALKANRDPSDGTA